jgi:hypothetical protein
MSNINTPKAILKTAERFLNLLRRKFFIGRVYMPILRFTPLLIIPFIIFENFSQPEINAI